MYISILGRQPALGIAELERLHGSRQVRQLSSQSAVIDTDTFDFERLGGSQKAGRFILDLPRGDWRQASMKLVRHYLESWKNADSKITLGISAYGFSASAREIQKTGIILKTKLKAQGTSLRLVPNNDAALNTATSHHNKLGLSPNHIEIIVVRANDGRVIVAESIGAQNITAYAKRDQDRPKRDAFVGMLPPKLAQIIVNLAVGDADPQHGGVVLDPFCGTGVILQEASLMGFDIYGTDLSDKMIEYTGKNLNWLKTLAGNRITTHSADGRYYRLEQGDAMAHTWQPAPMFVACESYLGQPFSAPPSPAKLREVRGNCNHIISSFLTNIAKQLPSGASLCVAVPAWRDKNGNFSHLPLVDQLKKLGYQRYEFATTTDADLLYYREDQVVARELLVLTKV